MNEENLKEDDIKEENIKTEDIKTENAEANHNRHNFVKEREKHESGVGQQNKNLSLQNNTAQEIDLLDLCYALLDKWQYILFTLMLGAVLFNAYAYLLLEPTYEATAKLYVVSSSTDSEVDVSDLNLASSLQADYEELMLGYPVLNQVISKLGLNLSTDTLKGMITLENPTDTHILNITITSTNPELACNIANALAEIAIDYLPDVMSTYVPSIVQDAVVPTSQSGPNYLKYTLMGALIGALLYCMVVIIKYLLDNTIHTSSDMEKYFGIVPLASIPESDKFTAKNGSPNIRITKKVENRLYVRFPKFPFAVEEAMNRLRLNIKFCGANTRKIFVTSSYPNEGKSSVSLSLWKMMADLGFPTVFVDLDMRKSAIIDRYKFASDDEVKDIGYYLSGNAEYDEVIYRTNIENGYIVPCYNMLDNPSVLLDDERLSLLMKNLSESFRYVIIDSPPLESVSDALQIASVSDGALFVVKSGETPKNAVRQSLQQLDQVDCKLIGVVLNRVEASGRAYKKYYGKYGYSYGYGYYGTKDSSK